MIASAIKGVKELKTMSNSAAVASYITEMLRTRKLMGLIRFQLAALAAFCLATAIAPQAVAQVERFCGPNITLTANQWTMVGIPCEPDSDNNSIGDVFGPSLTATDYGITWIVWNRVYQTVDPGPPVISNDFYTKLTVTDKVTAGDALWLYTTVGGELDFDEPTIGASLTLDDPFEFPAVVGESNTSPRYYMFANPYDARVNWADLIFAGDGGRSFKTKTAINLDIVGANVHYWNGNTYYTRSLTSLPEEATFEPKEAAWLEMLAGVPPLVANLRVEVPAP
jgi:hypothetical protein